MTTSKHDKKGPELFFINDDMLAGIETLAKQYKHNRDHNTADFLMLVKTGLSKIVSITPLMNELAAKERALGQEKIRLAEFIEQLFPTIDKDKKD